MARKSKRLKNLVVEKSDIASSDEEIATPSRPGKKRRVLSDSDSDEGSGNKENFPNISSADDHVESKPKSSKKIRRCVDSSDEEDSNSNVGVATLTPKAQREKKLHALKRKVQSKKGLYISSDEDDEGESDSPMNSDDEDALPMFQHEDAPPEEAGSDDNEDIDGDLDDFVVDDDHVEMDDNQDESEESEEEITNAETSKRVRRKSNSKKRPRRAVKKSKLKSEDENDSEDENEDNFDYANPYKERDEEFENADIMDILSKKTDKDKKNAKLYKKEMGKYQFSVRSEHNKAAMISKKARYGIKFCVPDGGIFYCKIILFRYALNMDKVKTDRGFKAERNLDVKDDEFYDYMETSAYGELIRLKNL